MFRLFKLTQYMNTLDLKPPHLGGRNNSWREITVLRNLN
jgi:hypothetical protein